MKKIVTLVIGITLMTGLLAQTSPLDQSNGVEGPDAPDIQLIPIKH